MEIAEISKVSTIKRINADGEKLKEKVSRETAKMIKLKVAQDTAYWDLKEKLHQVEGNHERLQQNMVEVQMQHETISGQYQEELRLRPDTLNKLSSSREISGVLQEYSERLKETLSRCKLDQAALWDAYQRSGQVVRDLKQKQLQGHERSSRLVAGLEEKAKIMSDHENQIVQFFTAFKQQTESEIVELKQRVAALQAAEQELTKTNHEQSRALDKCTFDLEKKEEMISTLQKDLKQLISEYNSHIDEARNIVQQKDKQIKDLQDDEKELKEALANQDEYTKSVCDQNNKLIEKVAAMEEDHEKAASLINDMKTQVREATLLYDEVKKETKALLTERDCFLLDITHKDAVINKHIDEVQLRNTEIHKLTSELVSCKEEVTTKVTVIEELKSAFDRELNENGKLKRDYDAYINAMQVQIQELTNQLETKKEEIESIVTELQVKNEGLDSIKKKLDSMSKELCSKNEQMDLKNKEAESMENELNLKNNELESIRSEMTLKSVELDAKLRELDSKKKEINSKNTELEAKDKELGSKMNTITKMMCELKTGTDARAKLEQTLQRLKLETDRERELEREKQNKMANKIEYLGKTVKDKEESLSKQMSIIVEMRHEKERLHEKIQGMQGTIDNIQKELTGPLQPPPPADLDDNAVMFSPSKGDSARTSPILKKKELAGPRTEPTVEDILYSLRFSDSSVDDGSLDSMTVNRRFQALARGENLSPRPLAALKRRRDSPARPGSGPKPKTTEKGSTSLSQAKDDSKIKERKFFKTRRLVNKQN